MNYLKNHNSFETAYKIENYPWGFKLRTIMYVWIETLAKKGDRVARQTVDPRTGKLCAVKFSTYSNLMALYIDDKGHVQSTGVSAWSSREQVEEFAAAYGVADFNAEQLKQYNQLTGVKVVDHDPITGDAKKDFAVKWGKNHEGKYNEVRITFDRPDGVTPREMLEAMKTLNQDRLAEVFTPVYSRTFGDMAGTVRICIRGGFQLCTIGEDEYKEFLAGDGNVIAEERSAI